MDDAGTIKKINTLHLVPGMYIHDLDCAWMDHPFVSNSFLVKDEATARKIRRLGIRQVYIDSARGEDIKGAPTREDVNSEIDRQMGAIASGEFPKATTFAEEAPVARKLHGDAFKVVHSLLGDVRLGKQVDLDRVEPMVEGIVDTIFRNKNAILPLAQLKIHDDYTFEHSVSVCALMVAFARAMELPRATVMEIARGALLHDVGKARVPDAILNKPDKLTDSEFIKMKSHVVLSKMILQETPGISQIALDVASQHHERFDGSGYPNKLSGDQISVYGQMGSIVDVYDALSSERVYHRGMPPTLALKKLLEWSNHHFEPTMVQTFIRAVGIYPTGSLVRLKSERLAMVIEQNETDLICPIVRVIFSIRLNAYVTPELVDLQKSQDEIESYESYQKWEIDPTQWQPYAA